MCSKVFKTMLQVKCVLTNRRTIDRRGDGKFVGLDMLRIWSVLAMRNYAAGVTDQHGREGEVEKFG